MTIHSSLGRRRAVVTAIAAAGMLAAGATAATAAAAGSGQHKNGKVTLCHATPPASAKNGWVQITVSTDAVTHHGHGDHADDIIPAFDYWVKGAEHSYPGKNLQTRFGGSTGQQILADGCSAAAPSSTASGSPANGHKGGGNGDTTSGRPANSGPKAGGHGNGGHKNGKVTLCHATPPASAKNGWVQITVSTNAVTHHGHGDHADDIIPAFDYWVKGVQFSYPGKNLDTEFGSMTGGQLLAAGCELDTAPSSGAPSSDATTTAATAAAGGSTQPSGPSAGASGAVAGVAVGRGPNGGARGTAVANGNGANANGANAKGADAPQGAAVNGIAAGDTGDHASSVSPGVAAAATVGAVLALIVGLAVLALRRRNPGAGA